MNFGKVKAVFFILVFLLLLALVVHWALGLDAKKHAADIPEDEPEQTVITPPPVPENPAEPAQAQNTPIPAPTPVPQNRPAPTQAPQNNPAPTQAPAPTPVPTPTPMPSGQSLGSGSFRSETGTGLELICDWNAVSVEGNKAEVTLRVSIDSYTLYLNELTDRIHLRVGSQTASMTQPALSYEGGKTNTPFGSKTFTVELAEGNNGFPVAVEWHFGGVYHEVPLDVIECGGTITLTR